MRLKAFFGYDYFGMFSTPYFRRTHNQAWVLPASVEAEALPVAGSGLRFTISFI